jgi:hypothetical protein
MSESHCADCGVDVVTIGHWYMVSTEVWAASGLGPDDGVLCLVCLERRLGRPLGQRDFQLTTRANDGWMWRYRGRMLPRAWSKHVLARGERRHAAEASA